MLLPLLLGLASLPTKPTVVTPPLPKRAGKRSLTLSSNA